MRLPTFTDLYYTNATHIGNPDLKPEHAMTYRVGTRYHAGRFQAAFRDITAMAGTSSTMCRRRLPRG